MESPPARSGRSPCLIIGVLSAASFEARRAGILATWGRDALAQPHVDLVFLMGDPALEMPRRDGAMLYLPCPDDYRSLPQKIRWFCLWALGHTDAPWLFKCDDDTYVRVDRLTTAIDARRWSRPVIGCMDGKGDHFHGGAGYVISREAALSIAAHLTDKKGLEDWKVRDAIAAGGMWFEHDDRFCFDTAREPAPTNEQITCHYATPVRMRLLHDAFTRTLPDAQTAIPRILHHIWVGHCPIPDHLQRYRETWARHHPTWELRLWTEETLAPLVNQQQFDAARTSVQKSHIARYEVLHREGGVYVDFDMECLRPIDDLLPGVTGFAAAEDEDAVGIAILGAVRDDALMARVIAALGASEANGTNPSQETGSRFFTQHLLAHHDWRLFRWDASVEHAYAIHHSEGPWKAASAQPADDGSMLRLIRRWWRVCREP